MTGRNFKKSEDAVSPVIGVILMVAITVILAAVIGAFVFGMGSGVQKSYIVAATASQVGSDIVVTYNGGPDADYVSCINVTEAGNAAAIYLKDGTNETLTGNAVGTSATYAVAGSDGKTDHVIVVATFTDGSQQIILDTNV